MNPSIFDADEYSHLGADALILRWSLGRWRGRRDEINIGAYWLFL